MEVIRTTCEPLSPPVLNKSDKHNMEFIMDAKKFYTTY